MEQNNTVTLMSVLHEIVGRVVKDENSPFNTMMRKTKDIDIDYFEKVSRGNNRLSEQLNLGLKDHVIDAFAKMADGYYVNGDLLSQLKKLAFQKSEITKDKKEFLTTLAGELRWAADREVPSSGWARYTNADLQEKYRNAKEITLKEFFMGSNGKDILEFYSALMDNTWWACRELIVERTKQFLRDLAKGIEEDAESKVGESEEGEVRKNNDGMELPEELLELAEQMAERVHDVWAEERIHQGWSYGEQRDDVLKKHPCLIPYDNLPEEEKIYDRNTSMETLKFILKQGFKIVKE